MATGRPDIRLIGIHKWYRGVHALRGVDLHLRAGRVHALLGQNGAGKSTLIKVLTGAVAHDEGEIQIDGRPVTFHSPADAEAAGIGVVHQESQFFPELSVADNIVAAHPSARGVGPLRVRDRKGARVRARELLERLSIGLDVSRPARELGPGERKLMEVARAISTDARAILLDEPTAALEPREVVNLFRLLARLRLHGVAVLFVSHKLDEVLAIANEITVLRDGMMVTNAETRGLVIDDLVHLVAGKSLEVMDDPGPRAVGEATVRARKVETGAVGPVDLDVRRGEVVSLTGLLGCGASQFARSIVGAARFRSGQVLVRGDRSLRSGDRASATSYGLGYLPEDRTAEGIVPELTVEQNIVLASIESLSRRGVLSRARMREQAERYIDLLHIRPPDPTVPAGNLSGGNQQKLLLARWLASGADVLVIEEPTHGLDVGTKPEIHALLLRFASDGGSVVLVSTELAEILKLSDRTGVFREGRLISILPRGSTEKEITARSVGLTAVGGA